jgi:hypothetical protein
MAGESARSRARRLRQSAEHWESVSEAEEVTATALMALPPSWTVLHGPDWPGERFANIDHVVVGPPGVFVIDTKLWSGQVTVENGVLWQSGQDRSPACWGAAAAAKSLAELVSSVRPDHVQAVVCLADEDIPMAWVDGVMVCSSAQLVSQLTEYAEVLPGGLALAVATDVDRRLRSVVQAVSIQRAGPKRRPFTALVLGVLAVAVAVALLGQPEMLTSLADDVKDWAGGLGK